MLTTTMMKSREYAQVIAKVVAALPPERAAQVYDFARFLQSQLATSHPRRAEEDDWLDDTEADMLAEDALWQATYDQHRVKFLQLRERALQEIASGETQPLFDENGDVQA